MNPASGNHTDIPEGAIQLVPVNKNMQFNQFVDGSWKQLTVRFNIDVEKVGGYKPSTTAAKGTLPVYNSQSKLPGSITGNAETASKLETARTIDLAGYISGTAVKFDGSQDISLEVTRIDVNNENDDVLNGKVSIKHGGTGRDDGAAADVIFSGSKKASAYGQIGNAVSVTGKHIDTLTTDGNYISVGVSIDNGWPYNTSGAIGVVRVTSNGSIIHQTLYCSGESVWQRFSTNSGGSWSKLVPISTRGSGLSVYISKSGNDNNTGMDSSHPVLTINRALQIANGWRVSYGDAFVRFYVGEGDWGNLTLNKTPYYLHITSYSGDTASEYSDSLPHFSMIYSTGSVITIGSIVCDYLDCSLNGAVLMSTHYIRVATMRARHGGVIEIDGSSSASPIEVISKTSHDYVYNAYNFGYICHLGSRPVNIVENLTLSGAFILVNTHSHISMNGAVIKTKDGISVNGKKYEVSNDSFISRVELDSLPGTIAGTKYVGATINGIPYGGGSADKALMADLSWKPVLLQTGGTIEGKLQINYTANNFGMCNPDVTKGEIPSATKYWNLQFSDNSGLSSGSTRIGLLESKLNTDGSTQIDLCAYKNEKSSTTRATLSVYCKSDGSFLATAPTPPDSAIATEIITAAWYNKKIESYIPKTGGTFTGEVRGYTGLSNNSSNLFATTAWVRMATGDTSLTSADSKKWNGAGKTISTAMPSGGDDGDLWFRY